ncbi:MAG: transposase [Candidatus Zixiibacteriota bacterium]
MSKLLRYYSPGNVYFVTAVTHRRAPVLVENIDLFQRALERTGQVCLISIVAHVVLPDHFHMIANPKDDDLSSILQRIKMSFATNYRKRHGMYRGRVWQNRFWDHIIRDQTDLNKHLDYIHLNPVKHGYVRCPADWEYSSVHDYIERGVYAKDWGLRETIVVDGQFGE